MLRCWHDKTIMMLSWFKPKISHQRHCLNQSLSSECFPIFAIFLSFCLKFGNGSIHYNRSENCNNCLSAKTFLTIYRKCADTVGFHKKIRKSEIFIFSRQNTQKKGENWNHLYHLTIKNDWFYHMHGSYFFHDQSQSRMFVQVSIYQS